MKYLTLEAEAILAKFVKEDYIKNKSTKDRPWNKEIKKYYFIVDNSNQEIVSSTSKKWWDSDRTYKDFVEFINTRPMYNIVYTVINKNKVKATEITEDIYNIIMDSWKYGVLPPALDINNYKDILVKN